MSIKSTIAAAFAAPFLLSSAAFAGPYVNVESNASYPDGDYSGAKENYFKVINYVYTIN